jgi:hypothetical protein
MFDEPLALYYRRTGLAKEALGVVKNVRANVASSPRWRRRRLNPAAPRNHNND